MNAQLFSSKTSFHGQSVVRQVLTLWSVLKTVLVPQVQPEPGCSARYTKLQIQQQQATRLFWLASAGLLLYVLLAACVRS
jgi:hypothetical protein